MTLRHLQIFLAVCETKNMTAAANQLFMTQPSVSQAIKELETHYCVKLFDRNGRMLSITKAGYILQSYGIHIVNNFEELEKKLGTVNKETALRIGANVTVGVTMIQGLIKQYREDYPQVRVEVFVNNSRAIRERIDRDELDFALVEEFPQMEAYLTEPFFEDRNIVVAPINHHLCEKKDISASDLANEDLLLREKGSGVRNLFDIIMEKKGITIHPLWESYTSDALIEAVKADLGITVLPERIVRKHIQSKEMAELHISDLDLSRRLILLKHRDKILSEEGEAFIRLVKEQDWNQ